MKVYCNGDIINKDQIKEIFEPGFLFGWGVYEPFRVYNRSISFLTEHIERLNSSLEKIGIEKVTLDWSKAIKDLLVENNLTDAYVRITAYKKRKGTGILIYADNFGYYKPETYNKGFSSVISPYKRNPQEVTSQIKSLSYLSNRLSWFSAQKVKKDEALVLNIEGGLAGGARSSIFLVKGNEIITPPSSCGGFSSVTAKAVRKIAQYLGLTFKEEKVKIKDIYSCDEAFLTSALLEIMPLVECEQRPIGSGEPGSVTGKILEEYRKLLENPVN
ncbi:MAG: aminotransferase class IV [Candidatus Omnitrophica bacterium]|nr:aminotransferase class IV [Candidatus Omnitrophota bacterium]MDD5430198.1 aminotransferase class IV [Candidatus Omnitrophota bacterium]